MTTQIKCVKGHISNGQTPTEHRKAKGGCGYAATHPLTIQETENKDPKSKTKLTGGGGQYVQHSWDIQYPREFCNQQIDKLKLTIDKRFVLKVSLPFPEKLLVGAKIEPTGPTSNQNQEILTQRPGRGGHQIENLTQ